MKQSVNPIQLVMKMSQLVDEVANQGPSTAADLAKAVDEPRPSVYRSLSSLEHAGYVRRSGDGRIELGTGILRLAEAASDALVDRGILNGRLESIQSGLGLTASFWIPRQGTAVCLEQVDATDVDLYELSSGRILPLHAGAASHVLLSHQPQQAIDDILREEPYRQLSSATPRDAASLQRHLTATREAGWRLEMNEVVDEIAAISFPVFNPDGSIFGALTAAGLVDHVLAQEEEVKRVLKAAARDLTSSMAAFRPQPAPQEFSAPDTKGSVIAKAAALMEALATERLSTSSRLTELLGEPISSVYRMLATLLEANWIEQVGRRGAYRVSSKLISLAGQLLNGLDLRRAAVPILRDIHECTEETSFLCIRRNARAVCIERIDGKRVNSRVLALGNSLPLHVGAAPRALLAFDRREAWDEYAKVRTQSSDMHFGTRSTTDFFNDLESIRQAGYAVSDDELTRGIAAIGAPIFDHHGQVVASLSVSGLRTSILGPGRNGTPVVQLALQGARALSDYLGAPADQR